MIFSPSNFTVNQYLKIQQQNTEMLNNGCQNLHV